MTRRLADYSPSGIQERQTVDTDCRQWRKDGTWLKLRDHLREVSP